MNSWIEGVLDVEDMRRRCKAHGRWLADHPDAVAFAEAWADRNSVPFDLEGIDQRLARTVANRDGG
jgi:hypothetical protein